MTLPPNIFTVTNTTSLLYVQLGDYECECEDGWTGKNCDEELDECVSAPCLNGATCKDRLNGFDCTCPPGFTGNYLPSLLLQVTPMSLLGMGTASHTFKAQTL